MLNGIKMHRRRLASFFAKFDFIEQRFDWRWTLSLIVSAYVFSVGIRFIWIFAVKNVPEAFWNGQFIPTTHDAFYWGSILQKALWGFHDGNRLVPSIFGGENAHLLIAFFLVKFFRVSLEAAMIYLSIFVSGLVVVPIILIGRLYKSALVGWCAAIIACVVPSFYNRTLAGYFDTDMFSVFFIVLILYFLIASVETGKLKYAYLASLASIAAPFFYLKITPIIYAVVLVFIVFNLIRRRKEDFVWESILLLTFVFWSGGLLSGLSAGGFSFGWIANLILLSALYKLLLRRPFASRTIICLSMASMILFLIINSPLQAVYDRAHQYMAREIAHTNTADEFYYLSKVGTISEAQTLPFGRFASQLAGSQAAFYLAAIGYALLLLKKPSFVLSLPLAGLALFSFSGGLRFVMYGAPIAALSIFYLLFAAFSLLLWKNGWKEKKTIIGILIVSAAIVLSHPSVKNIKNFVVPPVVYRSRIIALDELKKQADPKDYIVTWWDYGSLSWFYSGLRTLSAPSAQGDGASMFLISKILTGDKPAATANLSRWMVEKYAGYYSKERADGGFFDYFSDEAADPNAFLAKAGQNDFVLPAKTRDIFFYLPIDILNIAYPISTFSNINIENGAPGPEINYLIEARLQIGGDKILLPQQNLIADFSRLTLKNESTGFDLPVNAFHVVRYDEKGRARSDDFVKNKNADLHFIYLKDHGAAIILGSRLFNSALVQMSVFDNYDKDLFEPVFLSPYAKVYKLKI